MRTYLLAVAAWFAFCAAFSTTASAQVPTPVIFVHGITSSGATWREMLTSLNFASDSIGGRLKVSSPGASGAAACSWYGSFDSQPTSDAAWSPLTSAGVGSKRFFAIDFTDSSDLTFEQQGRELKSVIDCVKSVTAVSQVVLVAHSMGGLASRQYIQSLVPDKPYANDVAELITIGTPHSGALQAFNFCKGSEALLWNPTAELGGQTYSCWMTAAQQLLPDSLAIARLNTTNPAFAFPAWVPTISIIGHYGSGWHSQLLGGDGLVPLASQSLIRAVPGPITRAVADVDVNIENCGDWVPHVCETRSMQVIDEIGKALNGVSGARVWVQTGDYSNLTASSVTLNAIAINLGFTSYSLMFTWGYSPTLLNNTLVVGVDFATQGLVVQSATLGVNAPGQTIYYRAQVVTPNGIGALGAMNQVRMPAAAIPSYLPPPVLATPLANATGQVIRPDLSWSSVDGATSYRVLVAREAASLPTDPTVAACATCAIDISTRGTSIRIDGNVLSPGTTYYWSVKARSPDRYGTWSSARRFDTAASSLLPAPGALSMSGGSTTGVGATPTLTWTSVAGATSYRLVIAASSSSLPSDPSSGECPSCLVNLTIPETQFTVPAGALSVPGTYVAQVKARNVNQLGNWSSTLSFSTHNPLVTSGLSTVDVAFSSNGNGTVSSPGGVVPLATPVQVTATPFVGYRFSAWYDSGVEFSRSATLQLVADRAYNLAATFVSAAQTSILAVSASPSYCGAVSGGGVVMSTANATVVATPNARCVFSGWYKNGVLIGIDATLTLSTVPVDTQLTAVFSPAVSNVPRPPKRISRGTNGALALSHEGDVFAWGPNYGSALVTSVAAAVSRPLRLADLDSLGNKAGVESGGGGGHFLTDSGKLYALGGNQQSVLTGTPGAVTSPTLVMSDVASVASDDFLTLVAKADGSVWAWGAFDPYTLNPLATSPTQITGISDVVQVAVGAWCAAALKRDGTVWTWGAGNAAQVGCLGDGSTSQRQLPSGAIDLAPHPIPTLSQIVQISCGSESCLALRNDGSVFAWGSNLSGVVGDGTTTIRYSAVQLGLSGITFVNVKHLNGLALTQDGHVYTWGRYTTGALGYTATANVLTPTLVPNIQGIAEISSDGTSALALDHDGYLWAWGTNAAQSLGVDSPDPIASAAKVKCPSGMVGEMNLLYDNCRFVVSVSSTGHGSATPTGDLQYSIGATDQVVALPQPGYAAVFSGTCRGTVLANVFSLAPVTGACTVQVAFSSTVSQESALSMSPASIDFGAQSLNTTSRLLSIVVTNRTQAAISFTGITTSSPFGLQTDCATFAPGASCTIAVSFTPAQEGVVDGTVLVTTSLGNTSIPLRGAGERSLVVHYYRSILRRDADAAGKAFWEAEAARVSALGGSVDEVWYAMATAFFSSAEYQSFHRDDAGFVSDLYRAFFNREPDAGGLAFWTSQLSAGQPRGVILASFLFSNEFADFTRAIFGSPAVRAEINMVMDFYRGLLSRLPDDGGFSFWLGRFRTAQCQGAAAVTAQADAVSGMFATGAEYAGRQRDNSQFVGDLYNAFLRRGGDVTGVLFWLHQLDSGAMTREQVRQQFVASPEFQARVANVTHEPCIN